MVMLILFLNRWIVSRGRFEIPQGRGARPVPITGWRGAVIGLAASFIVIVSLVPLAVIAVGAFTVSRGPVMQWGNWTLANMERVFINAPQPLVNSLIYAGAATLIGICFSAL